MFQQKYTSLSLNLSFSTAHHLCPKTNFMHSSNQIQHGTKLHHSWAQLWHNCTPTQWIFNWNRLITGKHPTVRQPLCYQCQGQVFFYIHGPVHCELNLITVQPDATYSVYYISVGSSTCFGCWHPSSGARTTVITASGIDLPGLLPSALIVELELIHVYRTVGIHLLWITTYHTIHMNQFQLNDESGW